jgi:predicted membrane-bound spermidine synthase
MLLCLESLQAVLLLGMPGLAALLSVSPYLFILVSPLAGALTGAEFPLACRLGLESGRPTGAVASGFQAADNAGAVLGAAATGLVLMPAFGLTASAALLACAKCASLMGIAFGARPRRASRAQTPLGLT